MGKTGSKSAKSAGPKKSGIRKRVTGNLDELRTAQFNDIQKKFGGNDSTVVADAISFRYMHLKKEWPNDFKA